ncbi:MAG: NUDIX domain-containing protein [Acidimicrobiales bacterium]|nr:NUDIX domain-containing protein [Acidimicrobiales bacterium]
MDNNARVAAAALARLASPAAVHDVAWGDVRLRVSAILDDKVGLGEGLPLEALGSVRVVVTAAMADGVGVLVVHDGSDDNVSVLPGGRVEPGETTVETATRELHEETGWTLDPESLRAVGVLHLRRLDDGGPTPGFPYPDNLMLVLTGTGVPPATDRWRDPEGQVHYSELLRADLALRAVGADPVETAFARAVLAGHASAT